MLAGEESDSGWQSLDHRRISVRPAPGTEPGTQHVWDTGGRGGALSLAVWEEGGGWGLLFQEG